MPENRVRHGEVEIVFDVVGQGPTVVLLHGWPDTAALWDEVGPRLVAAGFRVVTPDLRGCGRSSKPTSVDDYHMGHLVGDVAAVLDALGEERVAVVGHDWGAALAWVVATYLSERVSHLVALSVGHPTAFRGGGLEQQRRSWYTLLFSYEGLGEKVLRFNDHEALRRWVGHPRAEAVIAELERDGQMSTHLLWYRANLPPDAFVSEAPVLAPVTVPTLGVWSSGDFALTEDQMLRSRDYCAGPFTYRRIEGVGHWTPLEAPEEVSAAIVAHLRARDGTKVTNPH